jgi:hypothetical protein
MKPRARLGVEALEDRSLPSGFAALDPAANPPQLDRGAPVKLLHTYQTSSAAEVANTIPVSADKLLSLLPDEYEFVPAAAVGLGRWDQGIVVIANFRGDDPQVDHRRPRQDQQVAIDVLILVNEPAEAAAVGLNIPGAFHLYTLAIYTNDPQYAASLRVADMPVELAPGIIYDRLMDDATGVGDVNVAVPARDSPFYSFNTGFGYEPASALDTVFWHNGKHGKAVLHFHDEPFQQGLALSQIYTQPGSKWDNLLQGGGIGPGTPDPITGYDCIVTPSLNFRFGEGTSGRLWLIGPPAPVKSRVASSPTETFAGLLGLDSVGFARSRPGGGVVEWHGVASMNGTATTSDNDYIARTGTLTFAPGETTKTITIEVKGDSKRESNETFYLDLFGNSSNSLFTKNRGLGTILNDD